MVWRVAGGVTWFCPWKALSQSRAHRHSVLPSQALTSLFWTQPTLNLNHTQRQFQKQGWFNIFQHISTWRYYIKIEFFIKTARRNNHCYSRNTVFKKQRQQTSKSVTLSQTIQLSKLVFPSGEWAGGMSPAHCGRDPPVAGDDPGQPSHQA